MGRPCWVPWKRSKLASSAPLIVSCKRPALALTRPKVTSSVRVMGPYLPYLHTYIPGYIGAIVCSWLQRRRDQTVK